MIVCRLQAKIAGQVITGICPRPPPFTVVLAQPHTDVISSIRRRDVQGFSRLDLPMSDEIILVGREYSG
jgi:hypothetical protein